MIAEKGHLMDALFDNKENKVFVGNTDKLSEWIDDSGNEQRKVVERVRLLIKNYLELDNVSFLFGSGASVHLGAVSIRHFPKAIEEAIIAKQAGGTCVGIHDEFCKVVQTLQGKKAGEDLDRTSDQEIECEVERVMNYLSALQYVYGEERREATEQDKISQLVASIKEALFDLCDVRLTTIPAWLVDSKLKSASPHHKEQAELLKGPNKFVFHEKFVKSILQRPTNLRRANIFTANYDLAFEYSFDNLGVHYVDGFSGFHKRFFNPEMFNYDLFYPGSTTSGKVERIERVVKYYKLHGSLSWIASEKKDSSNLYGVEELPLELINSSGKRGEIIIFPSAVKKAYTLDLPYSELIRQFSATISQPQSVLFTIGYSFADEHLNDIIYQALSIPSFTLIIVDFNGTKQKGIAALKTLNDPRVIICEGNYFGDFLTFAEHLMPDFLELSSSAKIVNTLNQLYAVNPSKTGAKKP